jgi:tripartite-type tricarboxylate transporter receptor subunit TctC
MDVWRYTQGGITAACPPKEKDPMAILFRRFVCAVAGSMLLICGLAVAQDAYPTRPVRIVVAYPPGGAVDTIARKVAQKLSEQMGQQFVVENKPGASGTIGAREVARAEPDGYTLLAIDNSYAMLPYVFAKLPWDYETDLVPITVSAFSPIMVVVGESSNFKDLGGLLEDARQNPEKFTYGTGGNGSATHFAAEAFQQAAGIKLYHVPYKGAGDAVVGVMSGDVDLITASPPSVMGNIRGGQMRALAISGAERIPALQDVPTFADAGLPQYSVLNWSGLAAPKGTSSEIIEKLHAEVAKALAEPDVREFLTSQGAKAGGMPPEAFAHLLQEETIRWRDVAAAAGFEAK